MIRGRVRPQGPPSRRCSPASVRVRAPPALQSANRVRDPGIDGPEDANSRPDEVLLVVVVAFELGYLHRRDLGLRDDLEPKADLAHPGFPRSELVAAHLEIEPELVLAVLAGGRLVLDNDPVTALFSFGRFRGLAGVALFC